MKLKELLNILQGVQKKLNISPCFLVGGTPRDRLLNQLDKLNDLDFTTGDKSIHLLSDEFYRLLNKKFNIQLKTAGDGHSTIYFNNLKLDFSSNFNTPNINLILNKMGIKNPTDMQKELYSRDFTINSLLLSLDLNQVIDPLNKGFEDINNKKIKTCLTPEITLTTNRNRVVRAIYLACKLDFIIDDSIINFVKNKPETIKISTPKALSEKLNEAFKYNPDKASYYLTKMKLWEQVPITEIMVPYYQRNIL